MRFRSFIPVLCFSCVHAGEPWLSPTLQIRARYEHADVDSPGLESSDAFTIRERMGLKFSSDFGLSAVVEGEFTQSILDRYDASAGDETSPDRPDRAQINDPENAELNQLWLLYSNAGTEFKIGRQRIILDNAAMIGNSGWRQNEQTYDGISIQNQTLPDLTLFYSYINRINRIFGEDATGVQNHFSGDIHLLNARYEGIEKAVVSGYIYLLDLHNTEGAFSNDTFGLSLKQGFPVGSALNGSLYGELAWQTDGGHSAIEYDAWYAHFIASVERVAHKLSLGYEHLGAADGTSFRTPLATAHAFNGFSDSLVGARIGGTPGGIGDLYAAYDVKLPWQCTGQVAVHWLGQDDFGFDYGKELDLVVSKKFDQHFQAILKLAFYDSEGSAPGALDNPAPFDVSRCSIEMNYSF